jgi:hypothetical protein
VLAKHAVGTGIDDGREGHNGVRVVSNDAGLSFVKHDENWHAIQDR